MKSLRLSVAFVLAGLALAAPAGGAEERPRVLAIELDNDINPVTADFVVDELERANEEDFDAAVIVLDTPGGLSTSMEKIFKAELASETPVVVYVAPDGASATSAGVFVAQAADILAMAPSTTIGSSTPITGTGEDLDEDLRRKAVNSFASQLRTLAERHGRNGDWAEEAVRSASNLTETEALAMNVIDLIAPSLPALLNEIDGMEVDGQPIHTANAEVEEASLSGWKRILDLLVDPNVIALLLSIGTLGIIVELWNPGLVFPGTVGAISLILALLGASVLPISWAGVLLMILFDPAGPNYQVSLWVALAIALSISTFMFFVAAKLVQARRRPPEIGEHAMVGTVAVVGRDGWVVAQGERWHATSSDDRPLRPGDEVRVVGVDGLTLAVEHEPEREPVA